MSANRHDTHCPECGTTDIEEASRQEGGFSNTTGEDTIIYQCQREECRHVWDTEMARPTKPRDCIHDDVAEVTTWGDLGAERTRGVCVPCGASMVQNDEGDWERP